MNNLENLYISLYKDSNTLITEQMFGKPILFEIMHNLQLQQDFYNMFWCTTQNLL